MADISFMPNPIVVGLQTVPFLLTLGGLHYLIFQPMLSYLEGREDAVDGARKRAAELEGALAGKAGAYEDKVRATRQTLAAERAAARARALAEADAVVAQARAAAEARVSAAVVEIGAQRDAARAGLAAQAHGLADRIADQVLGRTA